MCVGEKEETVKVGWGRGPDRKREREREKEAAVDSGACYIEGRGCGGRGREGPVCVVVEPGNKK
jgi:hypothetical protein